MEEQQVKTKKTLKIKESQSLELIKDERRTEIAGMAIVPDW